jgi:pyrophosphatase PpaX
LRLGRPKKNTQKFTKVSMKSYDAYLFDADGTLIDTMELICRSYEYSLGRFGAGEVSRGQIVSTVGMTLRMGLERFLGPMDEQRYREVSDAHMAFQYSIYEQFLRPCVDSLEAVAALKARGVKLAVVTSRRRESLEMYLDKTGFLPYFDALVTPESTAQHKPSAQPALRALELLGVEPAQALMVGDASVDIECGGAAGTDTAFVGWSVNAVESLRCVPTWQIDKMADLCVAGA